MHRLLCLFFLCIRSSDILISSPPSMRIAEGFARKVRPLQSNCNYGKRYLL